MKLQLKKSRFWAVVYGLVTSIVLLGLAYLVMNQPQCPDSYTQEQINAGGCIVGANIGLGLLVMAAPLVIIGCVVMFLGFSQPTKPTKKK